MSEARFGFGDFEFDPQGPDSTEMDHEEIEEMIRSTRILRLAVSARDYIGDRVEHPVSSDPEVLTPPHPAYAAATIAVREIAKFRSRQYADIGMDRDVEAMQLHDDSEALLCLGAAYTMAVGHVTEEYVAGAYPLFTDFYTTMDLAREQADQHPVVIALHEAWHEAQEELGIVLHSELQD